MVRTTLTACRPVCITTGSLAASHGSGREIFDQRAGAGVVIIGLSLMGSFRQNARWVRSAKTAVGFVWPKCPLGSFGQNACWVRLAKTPVGFVWPKRRPAHRWTVNPALFGVRKVRKGPLPTRRRQARRGFLHFLHFLQHKDATLQSRQQSDALRARYACCERFSSHDPNRKPR